MGSEFTPTDQQIFTDYIEADRNSYLAAHGPDSGSKYDQVLHALDNVFLTRREDAREFRPGLTSYNLPELPDSDINEVYERARAAEARLASPDLSRKGYELGTAQVADEPLVIAGLAEVLLTAEHATQHRRLNGKGQRTAKEADWGTGAVSKLVQEDTNQALILPLGRQTKDANTDVDHWIKDELGGLMERNSARAHYSVHNIGPTRAAELTDPRSFGVMLGLGKEWTPETDELVTRMRRIADTYGLRLGVNQPFIKFAEKAPRRPERTEDGSLKRVTYAASGAGTTRTFSQEKAAALGKPFASVQIELSNALTLVPEDWHLYPGRESQKRGVHLGYHFLRDCVELVSAGDVQ